MNRKVKLLCALFTALLLFTGCNSKEKVMALTEAAENTNSSGRYKATFFMSVSPVGAEDTTNMFAQGEINVDKRDKLILSGVMTQYAFEQTSAVNLYYEDGKYYTDLPAEGIKAYTLTTDESLKGQFICAGVPVFDENNIKKVKVTSKDGETTYLFKLKDAAALEKLLGENIYQFTTATNPEYERTKFGEADCEFVVANIGGNMMVKSFNISYTVTVYNQKPYVPGVNYDDKEFRFEDLVTLRMSFKAYGDDVVITRPGDLDKYVLDSEVEHEESE